MHWESTSWLDTTGGMFPKSSVGISHCCPVGKPEGEKKNLEGDRIIPRSNKKAYEVNLSKAD